ncbi:MAG: hypothetical protein ABR577_17240 [Pyrinomonadaceae bacterium]
MTNEGDDEAGMTLRRIGEVLSLHGAAALNGNTIEAAARQWIAAGFEDEEEINDWLRAGCRSATDAARLEAYGITPEQAALRTTAGAANYEDTIARKIINGDLSGDEAKRIITNAFWNS